MILYGIVRRGMTMHQSIRATPKFTMVAVALLLTSCGSDAYSIHWRAVVEAEDTRTGWAYLLFAPTYTSHKDCYRMVAPANPGKRVVCLPYGKSYWAVRLQNAYVGNSHFTYCIARTPSEDMYWPNLAPLKPVPATASGDDWYCYD